MLTPPLPIRLECAELRLAGTVLMASAHGLTIRIQLTAERAAEMWAAVGQAPGVDAVRIPAEVSGVEICKIGWGARGVRAWVGSVEVRMSIPYGWFDHLSREEMAARERRGGVVHVA